MSGENSKPVVLILGANGFIGSHLVDHLVEEGFAVRAFDRFSNSPQFNDSKDIEIFKGDFADDIAIDKAMKNVDYLFHSFSATTPFVSDTDPYKDITTNVLRSIQLFEVAVEKGVKKVIYISSGGAVYGHIAEQKPVSENDVPRPVSPYGIGKLTTEYYLEYFNRKYELDYIIYRLSNPYGLRQAAKNNQGVIPSFLNEISNGRSLKIIGDGTSSRDYIYIDDAADMIAKTFNKNSKDKIYNLGSGIQVSVNEIVSVLSGKLGIQAKVDYVDAPKTFLRKSQIDISRFSNEFQLKAHTSLEEGIESLLRYKNMRK